MRVGVVQQQTGTTHGVNHVAIGRIVSQHRQFMSHGFNERHAETFMPAQGNKEVAAAIHRSQGVIIDLAS
ncbi:hypothetical protein D3C84_1227450 [compost metagenome]